ncbi:hypothetical protein [Vibrio sp. D431a]|uniref:hypothetical protein n=1 Tax=Vibrio sp. D431a TaxID=2837388 RepID=UPI002553F629|nr:hypothetical protein [Vibrio sp. D431a]MDK9790026.1 hypothetical protein [Vibrio sp. D431a]
MLALKLDTHGKNKKQKEEAMEALKKLSNESNTLNAEIKGHEIEVVSLKSNSPHQYIFIEIKKAEEQIAKENNEIFELINERTSAFYSEDMNAVLQIQTRLAQKIEKGKHLQEQHERLITQAGQTWVRVKELERKTIQKLNRLCEINLELANLGFRKA